MEMRKILQGGKVTIPKKIREEFGLIEGTVVKIATRGNVIEIIPPEKLSKLLGLVNTNTPVDDPKRVTRKY